MIRRAASVAWLVALATLLLPAAALAATVEADASDYPAVRAIFVTDQPTVAAPKLTENGEPVTGLVATNLGRAKSIVLAVDRSQSMDGQPLTDAVEAARAFVAAKPPGRQDLGADLRDRADLPHRLPDLDHGRRLGPPLHLDQPGAGHDALRRARPLAPTRSPPRRISDA